jgi:LysR family transcriptional regulator, transcriptional activator of the cysJI operon
MNIEQIKAFHKVASTGSFTRAARELFVTQPAVSHGIKTLESSLGVILFDRSGKKARMTAEGEILFSRTQQLFALHEEIESLFGRLKTLQYGSIRIGSSALVGTYFLPKIIGRFNRNYPGIHVDLRMGNSDEIIQRVRDGAVDLGFAGMVVKDTKIRFVPVHQEKLIMVVSPRHRLSGRKTTLDDISGIPFIWRERGTQTRKLIEKWFDGKPSYRYPREAIELENMEAAKRMVEEGYGATVFPEAAVRREISAGLLKRLDLEGLNLVNSYYLLFLKGKKPTRAVEAFMKMLSGTRLLSQSGDLRTHLRSTLSGDRE